MLIFTEALWRSSADRPLLGDCKVRGTKPLITGAALTARLLSPNEFMSIWACVTGWAKATRMWTRWGGLKERQRMTSLMRNHTIMYCLNGKRMHVHYSSEAWAYLSSVGMEYEKQIVCKWRIKVGVFRPNFNSHLGGWILETIFLNSIL